MTSTGRPALLLIQPEQSISMSVCSQVQPGMFEAPTAVITACVSLMKPVHLTRPMSACEEQPQIAGNQPRAVLEDYSTSLLKQHVC